MDQAGYANMLETLGDEQLDVTTYDTTSLSGHIDVKEDGLLFLSIPYAEGWSAEVDGKPAEILPVQNALMGIMLDKGSHDVALKYTPAGFKEGALISFASVFGIALLIAVPALVRKKKSKVAVVSEQTGEENKGLSESVIEEVPVSEFIEQAEDKVEPEKPEESDD